MNCYRCNGSMTEQITDICLCERSPATKITGVPAFVCVHCGERVYSSEVSLKLDDIRERFDALEYNSVQPLFVYQYDAPLAIPPGARWWRMGHPLPP